MENIIFTAFDIFNFGLVIFFWWFTLKHYKNLPERIPVHFDFDGKADNFGSKKYSFLTPIIGTALFCFFAYALKCKAKSTVIYSYFISDRKFNHPFYFCSPIQMIHSKVSCYFKPIYK
jgi:uncharacterized membrane protein